MAHSSMLVSLDDEIQDHAEKMSSMNIVTSGKRSFSKEEVVCKLARLQCPFTWKLESDRTRNVRDLTEDKLDKFEDETEVFVAWTKYVLNLILCYEYACTGFLERAFEKQEECHLIVEHAMLTDVSIPVIGVGLKHVSDASQIFLLMKSKFYEKAIENLHCITQIEEMDRREQASIWGVCGALYMEYGLKATKESLTVIKKALKLDPKCAEWHFLMGTALSRVRHIENVKRVPENEELEALENAVEMSNNAYYMVLLAHTYENTARQIFHKKAIVYYNLFNSNVHTDRDSLINEINERAYELYQKAYENSKDNSFVLARCAHGFLKLPHPWRNMELAKICIHRGLEKNSSCMFLIECAADFYRRLNENEKAKYYFACAAEKGSSIASLRLLDIKLKENTLYDPVPDMERLIYSFHQEKSTREFILGLLGVFFYFVKNDFNTALKYWQQLIDSDINSTHLEVLYSNEWIGAPRTCSISKTIIKEVLIRLESCSEEEKIIYDNVLITYLKHHPQLVESIQRVYNERSQRKY